MAQRLILPIGEMKISANYKNALYQKQFGYRHYGLDCGSVSGTRTLRAIGAGEVAACGQDGETLTGPDSRLGNVLVVRYPQVVCHDGRIRDLVCRMYHLERIDVSAGQRVETGDILGRYGNTGANTTGAHLHIEFDTDTAWPTLAPGVRIGGRVINRSDDYQRAGGLADSTLDPSTVWYLAPDQTVQGVTAGWYAEKDIDLPVLPQEDGTLAALRAENERLRGAITSYETERAQIYNELLEIITLVQ